MRHQLVVEPTKADVAAAGARLVADRAAVAVADHGQFVFAVSGGTTPWEMFSHLAVASGGDGNDGGDGIEMPWKSTVVYQVDERVTGADDPERNLAHLRAALGDAPAEVIAMPVEAGDLEAAADRYASLLPDRFDLVHLGLGPDGHTASLVPGDPVLAETRPLVWTTTSEYQGHRRMTLTYSALARADELVWLVTGNEKGDALRRLLAGDREIPAGRIEGPRRSTIFADTDAAGGADTR